MMAQTRTRPPRQDSKITLAAFSRYTGRHNRPAAAPLTPHFGLNPPVSVLS